MRKCEAKKMDDGLIKVVKFFSNLIRSQSEKREALSDVARSKAGEVRIISQFVGGDGLFFFIFAVVVVDLLWPFLIFTL